MYVYVRKCICIHHQPWEVLNNLHTGLLQCTVDLLGGGGGGIRNRGGGERKRGAGGRGGGEGELGDTQ